MSELLQGLVEQGNTLTLEEIIINIVTAAFLSIAIYISYYFTHVGTAYSRKFNVSLMTLTVLTATVMTVIGNNIALSLGMVGALSIVRFRTAIKDSRDTTYIFWAIIVGICCGVGDYLVACVGSSTVFIMLLLLGRVRNENRILIMIKADRTKEMAIEGIIFDYFNKKAVLRVKNASGKDIDFILKIKKKIYSLSYKHDQSITDKIYSLGDIEYVNIITQSDEISG